MFRFVPSIRRALVILPKRSFASTGRITVGAPDDVKLPHLENQVQGLQKRELDAIRAGKSVFPTNEGLLTGPFGTEANPVKVPSAFSSRIVGCTGGSGDHSHELLWHEVHEGETVVCMACSQFFKLERIAVEPDHHHHHAEGDAAHAHH